ncbi:hypothetical protein M758_1G184500 [Ceratodon purpureus]|nr:hypothetical protein M758_1G184500 [Ceratodon purpureus]
MFVVEVLWLHCGLGWRLHSSAVSWFLVLVAFGGIQCGCLCDASRGGIGGECDLEMRSCVLCCCYEIIQFTCRFVLCQCCISAGLKFSSGIGLDLFALILLVCCT